MSARLLESAPTRRDRSSSTHGRAIRTRRSATIERFHVADRGSARRSARQRVDDRCGGQSEPTRPFSIPTRLPARRDRPQQSRRRALRRQAREIRRLAIVARRVSAQDHDAGSKSAAVSRVELGDVLPARHLRTWVTRARAAACRMRTSQRNGRVGAARCRLVGCRRVCASLSQTGSASSLAKCVGHHGVFAPHAALRAAITRAGRPSEGSRRTGTAPTVLELRARPARVAARLMRAARRAGC